MELFFSEREDDDDERRRNRLLSGEYLLGTFEIRYSNRGPENGVSYRCYRLLS